MGTDIIKGLLIITLCMASQNNGQQCPEGCTCTLMKFSPRINCRNAHLREVPSDLPYTITKLDLSENKDLILPYDVFRNRTIYALYLQGVGLNKPFLLPMKISSLMLDDNKLTIEDLRQLPFYPVKSLLSMSLNNNGIYFGKEFVFKNTPSLISLSLSGNSVPTVGSNLFQDLQHLQFLVMKNCNISSVKENAFTKMPRLFKLEMSKNKLRALPAKLFLNNSGISHLNFAYNEIEIFRSGSKTMTLSTLDLQNNKLRDAGNVFSIQTASLVLSYNLLQHVPSALRQKEVKSFSLDLSSNFITRVESYAFGNASIKIINLGKNRINYVDIDAFKGLRNPFAIYLNGNNITYLPKGIFSGLRLRHILLHENEICALNFTFYGLKSTATTVTLFRNQISHVNNAVVHGLSDSTHVFVDCDKLLEIRVDKANSTRLECATSQRMTFKRLSVSVANALVMGGFECDITSELRMASCKSCPAGMFNDGRSNKCTCCFRGGFFQSQYAQSKCLHCNLGMFVNKTCGSSRLDCKTCPKGTDPDRFADYRACYCLPGFYRKNRFGRCFECDQSGILCKNDTRMLKPGYWWYWVDRKAKSNYKCFVENILTLGNNYEPLCSSFYSNLPHIHKCSFKRACLGGMDAKCQKNYTGPLCATCNDGYFRTQLGCIKCKSKMSVVLRTFTIPLILIFSALIILYCDGKEVDCQDKRSMADVILSFSKIMIGHFQLLAVVFRLLAGISWPKNLVEVVESIYQLLVEIVPFPNLKCFHKSLEVTAFKEMLLVVLASICIPLIASIALMFHTFAIRKYNIDCSESHVKIVKGIYLRFILLYLFVTYPFVCQRIFQVLPLACRKLCFDSSNRVCIYYLNVDFRDICPSSDPSSWKYVNIAYVSCVFPVGFPLGLLYMLNYSRKRLKSYTGRRTQNNVICFGVRFCYENYEPSCWYWEIIEMVRKLLFTVGFAFFGLTTSTTIGSMILVTGVITIAYAYKKPIRHSSEHYLQMLSLTSLFLTLCMAVVLYIPDSKISTIYDPKQDWNGITIILLSVNSLVLVYGAYRMLHYLILKKCLHHT